MKKLLFISCSPRGDKSDSRQLAEHFIQGVINRSNDKWHVDVLNLWEQSLPEMDMAASNAKYAIMSGTPLTELEQRRWREIEQHFERFSNADVVVIALPMWNFGVPYVLKHYIDIITQPGLCFEWNPAKGYVPLVDPKRSILVSSSAGDYQQGSGHEDREFCITYLQKWLKVYFGYRVDTLIFAPTVQPENQVELARKTAFERANILIDNFPQTPEETTYVYN